MLNHVCLQGRICNDIELRRTGTGVAVASFTLAVDRDFKNAGGEKETDLFDIVCWRNTAEFVTRYFAKGKQIVVDGRLQSRHWADNEGKKRKAVEVVAESAYFCGDKSNSAANTAPAFAAPAAPASDFAMLDDDDARLPF